MTGKVRQLTGTTGKDKAAAQAAAQATAQAQIAAMPQPVAPPARSDAETQALAEEQRRRFGGARSGRASTYLTSGGLSDSSSAVRFLGGAART